MGNAEQIAYHCARAAKELNVGLLTSSMEAARAHLALSLLHIQRARELGADPASIRHPLEI